jgi:hypothetical protein
MQGHPEGLRMTFAWTPARVTELRRMFAEGKTRTEMSVALGTPSRSAVSGKLSRLGLKHDIEFVRARRRAGGRRVRVRAKAVQAPPLAPGAPARPARAPAIPEPPSLYRRRLVDLTNESCRWPVTEDHPHRFCGMPEADLANRIPYCRYHRRLAYRRPGEPEREAA